MCSFDEHGVLHYDKQSVRDDLTHIDFLAYRCFPGPCSNLTRSTVASIMADICRALSRQGLLSAFEVSQRFYEIGSLQGMRETDAYLSHR